MKDPIRKKGTGYRKDLALAKSFLIKQTQLLFNKYSAGKQENII